MSEIDWSRPRVPGRIAIDHAADEVLWEKAQRIYLEHEHLLWRTNGPMKRMLEHAIYVTLKEIRNETNVERDAEQRRGSDLPGTGEPEA